MPSPELLTGAVGLTIAAVSAVVVLWRSHERSDRAVELDRDYWRTLALTGTELAEKATTLAVRSPRPRKRAGDG